MKYSKEECNAFLNGLLKLKNDWDDDGGLPFNPDTIQHSIWVIDRIYQFFDDETQIDPCVDGTIDISFYGKCQGLLNISGGNKGAYYFESGEDTINESINCENWEKLISFLNKHQPCNK